MPASPPGEYPLKDGGGVQHRPAVLPLRQGGQLHPEGQRSVVLRNLPIGQRGELQQRHPASQGLPNANQVQIGILSFHKQIDFLL